MAFIKRHEHKELNLPSLIDLCFLLIIFSLVTLPITKARVETGHKGQKGMESRLPTTRLTTLENADYVLKTLLFEVGTSDPKDEKSPRIVYALVPNGKDSLTFQDAMEKAVRDSMFAEFPDGYARLDQARFLRLKGCRMIRDEIARYKSAHFLKPSYSNTVEIRAARDTEFRLIHYIMEVCAAYGDTIPRVVVHVAVSSGSTRGL
ncbi:MAG TPA: hypothetical protein VGB38_01270 [bacterium]